MDLRNDKLLFCMMFYANGIATGAILTWMYLK